MPRLVDLKSNIPNIRIDLKYASKDNFTGISLYDFNSCLVLDEVAVCLKKVQLELENIDLGLKIWDGFRPLSVQWKLWECLPDERYTSDPRKGGRHTRGTAVDVTLVKEGKELVMPTAFDDFTEKAYADSEDVLEEAKVNRDLLRKVMCKHGFLSYRFEWWHFDLRGWEHYPPIMPNLELI